LAARFGLTEEAIYNHPSNTELRKTRRSRNILNPGDQVFIPSTADHKEVCATGRDYHFVVRIPKVDLRVVLQDHSGKPFAGRTFKVAARGVAASGVTGSDGLVKVSVPATLETATLSAWLYEDDTAAKPDVEYELHLGRLDPHDTTTGVQARLQNLGYGCSVSGSIDEATLAAVNRFLHDHKHPPADEANPINDELCSLLLVRHDGGAK
jgi:N-acetylmuramoyl-L-alanine amidase